MDTKISLLNSDPNIEDVHTRHCNVNYCKYGEDFPDEDGYIECTVVSGRAPPENLNNGYDDEY